MNSGNLFKTALLATLAIKVVLAYILPMSGDEAYFVVWAKHPDFGFYDHPPMVGWILSLLLYLGSSEVILRLPAILLSTLIGWGIYRLLRPRDEMTALLVATLFLVAPVNIVNVLIATDTPLILFVFLSAASLCKALQANSKPWYAASGILLGLAFLSKYFAGLLMIAYLAFFIYSIRKEEQGRREKIQGLIILLFASLPFALVNLYWNYTHCWDNILFNLYTRNEQEVLSIGNVAIFFGTQIYLMTPPVIYCLYKHRAEVLQNGRLGQFGMFAFVFLVPMALFALLSLKKLIGLHWVLGFYPFFYLLLGLYLSREELLNLLKFMVWFSALHLAAIAVIAILPMETWKQLRLYDGIVFMFKNDAIVEHIKPYEKDFVLAADGYTPAAIVSYHYGKNFVVFGEGSHYARQDDMITDFRQLAGRNILIVKKTAPNLMEYVPYFQNVESKQFTVRGATFYLVLGYGFDYISYREQVLKLIKERYYRIPAFLPHAPCYFCEKYFPSSGEGC